MGRVQGDRSASGRFWAPAAAEGSPVYLSERPVSLPLRVSAAASPRSEAAAPELPRLTGRPGRFPRLPGQDVPLQPGSPQRPAPRAPRPASPSRLGSAPAPGKSCFSSGVGQALAPTLTPHPAPGLGCKVQPGGRAEGLGFTSDLRRADCLRPLEGEVGRGAERRDTP